MGASPHLPCTTVLAGVGRVSMSKENDMLVKEYTCFGITVGLEAWTDNVVYVLNPDYRSEEVLQRAVRAARMAHHIVYA